MSKLEYSSPPPPFLSPQGLDYYPDSSGSTVPFDTDAMPAGNAAVDEGYQTASATTTLGLSNPEVGDSGAAAIGESSAHLPAASSGASNSPVQGERSSHTASPEPGLEILGRGMRDMVEVINRLRQVGVEDFVLPLPKIAGSYRPRSH
jgi:hypothetical protein